MSQNSNNIFFDVNDLKSCGENVIIGKTVRIRKPSMVSIGKNSIIDDFTYIPCSLEMGNYSHIGANNTFIGGPGKVTIGDFVNIAPGCQIVTGTNDYRGGGLVGPTIPIEYSGVAIVEPIIINDHVLIGCQAVILPGVVLPEGVSIGAMSLVKKMEYTEWSLYAGNPIKFIGPRIKERMLEDAKKLQEREG